VARENEKMCGGDDRGKSISQRVDHKQSVANQYIQHSRPEILTSADLTTLQPWHPVHQKQNQKLDTSNNEHETP